MYIDPFWCGVIATVLAEVIALVVAVAISTWRKKRRDRKG